MRAGSDDPLAQRWLDRASDIACDSWIAVTFSQSNVRAKRENTFEGRIRAVSAWRGATRRGRRHKIPALTGIDRNNLNESDSSSMAAQPLLCMLMTLRMRFSASQSEGLRV
jgi:hypothetical protein